MIQYKTVDILAWRRLKPFPKQLKKFLFGIGSATLLFVFLLFGSRHLLLQADRKTEAPWRQIRRLVQRQLDLVSELTLLVANAPPEFAKPLRLLKETDQAFRQKHEAIAHSTSVTQSQLREYETAHRVMTTSVERVVRTWPGASANQFQEWLGCYWGVQKLLRTEEARYNVSASSYNRLYGTFFLSWVAEKFKMHNRPTFKETERHHGR